MLYIGMVILFIELQFFIASCFHQRKLTANNIPSCLYFIDLDFDLIVIMQFLLLHIYHFYITMNLSLDDDDTFLDIEKLDW